ncbi:uncharacterized protein M421DRAFT_262885 [Didymella exigua CBS 183.55]|uniref:Uncharacterized protein n=1 Tax=Didymella exigua CBS 183.55 TaxID=1150837 RepID=A0A6A5RAJ6_9PLEO|nr:uncharacterized protein M421DRAFT_262885 [Didymella exigua CBS 183.55]KAF1925241.1 hypothetical protein M421DRAFT_262885 [Didymella exigua CBS 183.55]
MCDATFTFGQRGSHFFQCPSRREIARLPAKLTAFLSSSQLQQVHHIALGFQDSFLITWRDRSGLDRMNSLGLPDELTTFLFAKNAQDQLIRNIPAIRCVLGPYNNSFFVHDSSAYIWMSIPDGLLTALQARIKSGSWIDKPRIVALGADDGFLLITEKNVAIWDLEKYKTVSDMLESARAQAHGIRDIRNIVLHAYRYGCYVAQSKTGALMHGNLPAHQISGIMCMLGPVLRDTERARGAERKIAERRESERDNLQRRPSGLQERARIKREWSDHKQQFTAQSKGLKLSVSVSFGVGGLARMLGGS